MMIEEVIEQLQLNKPSAYSELRNSIDMVMAALEKQIPKKPIENPTDDTCLYYENYCPSCENLLVVRYKHCPKCGQKIDWSEVKE